MQVSISVFKIMVTDDIKQDGENSKNRNHFEKEKQAAKFLPIVASGFIRQVLPMAVSQLAAFLHTQKIAKRGAN